MVTGDFPNFALAIAGSRQVTPTKANTIDALTITRPIGQLAAAAEGQMSQACFLKHNGCAEQPSC